MLRWLIACCFLLSAFNGRTQDTLYVESQSDSRLIKYLDTLKAYQTGYSVANNIAKAVRNAMGNNSLDSYFLGRFAPNSNNNSGEYFYTYNENVPVTIGRVNESFKGMKNDSILPWQVIEAQYKRLDSIKIQPSGVMQGAELPNVYIYPKPALTVIYTKVQRYTVVDPRVRFSTKGDGKTKISYITKLHYLKIGNNHEKIDSIEYLDPVSQKPIKF